MSHFDVIFLGSSPNALAAAARLGRARLRVLVLDTAARPGGPVVTEEIAPGFLASTGLMSAALDPEVAETLSLSLEVIRRDRVTSLAPRPLTLEALPALPAAVEQAIALLRAIHATSPPDLPAPPAADSRALGALGAKLLGLGERPMHEVLRLLFLSARDFFEEQVASEPVRALLAGAAVRGLSEGPFAQGTLFGFLHHQAVDDGLFRCTARGGLGALAQALAGAAASAGVEIRCAVPGPLRITVDDGVATGVRLGTGEQIRADRLVSDHDLHTTFTELLSPRELDPEVNRAIRAVRHRGSVARISLALAALPDFPGVDPEALRGTLVVAPEVAAIERAWDEAKRGALPRRPYVEIALPSVADPSLAPSGQHLLEAWIQYVPHGRGDRGGLLQTLMDTLAPFAPALAASVLHHHVSLPEDLERRFGLFQGQLYGAEVRLEQAFFHRPLPGFAHYRTPIAGLYLGGSAAHPGGYSGRSGWNLAAELLGDERR